MTNIGLKFRDVSCGECSRTFLTQYPRKLFCDPCGAKRRGRQTDSTRKRSLAHTRPEAVAEIAQSRTDVTTLPYAFHTNRDFAWAVSLSTPYSLDSSKNRRWSNSGAGVVFLTKSVRDYEAALIASVQRAMGGRKVAHNKVWIGLFIQKPNHRGDAVNAVDTICDAVKKAIGIDDRWFSIDQVDWEVVKDNPRIFIRIAQEENEDKLVCSHCGRIRSLECFHKSKSGPLGRSRSCRDCNSVINRLSIRRLAPEGASVSVFPALLPDASFIPAKGRE